MRFKRPSTTDIDLGTNIINLVDVLLLLLIFFMISTSFTKRSELNIQLPEASAAAAEHNDKQIDIFITADGRFSINDRDLVKTDVDSVKAALQEISEGDNTRPMSITADGNTPNQAVVRAMDAAGQLGFSHLSLTTQAPGKEK